MDGDSLEASSRAEMTPPDLRAALDRVLHESLQPFAAGLGALYVVFAVSHAFVQPLAVAVPMTIAASGTALVFFAFYVSMVLRRIAIPVRRAHPVGVGMASLVLLNSFLHLYLSADP
jgi:hypothetical protein